MLIHNPKHEGQLLPDLAKALVGIRNRRGFAAKAYVMAKVGRLNRYMGHFGLHACVVGVSGGVDSAVVLGLVAEAAKMPQSPITKILPILMPVFSETGATNQQEALEKGRLVCEYFGFPGVFVDLTGAHRVYQAIVDQALGVCGKGWASGQLVSYCRTPALYYMTSLLTEQDLAGVVCGTTNKDEGAYLGFFGKASDGMVDLQLVSDIHKSDVFAVAQFLGVPQSVREAVPSGDMFDGRSDEDVFGAPYDFVELYLHYLTLDAGEKLKWRGQLAPAADEQFGELAACLEKLHQHNKHKYLGRSPAVHLDVVSAQVPGGWVYEPWFG